VRPLRLAMIAQRFWPRVGSLETRAGQLARGLADLGVKVTVVTARWHRQWPAEIHYHDIPVVRLEPPPRGRWSTWRWTRVLRHWIRGHAEEFDLVCAWGLMHEAQAALQAAGSRVPVVLVPERIGWDGDCFRQVRVPGGHGIKSICLRANALVASSPAARRELEAAGYPRERILDLPAGAPLLPPRTPESQALARAMLADSSPTLQLAAIAPLVICTSRMEAGELLLAAWSIVVRQKAAARLWLVGESPEAMGMAGRIQAAGLSGRVGLIGRFDEVECLLAAADVHVAPAAECSSQPLVEAMAAGLPSVAIDMPLQRWLLGEGDAGLLAPPDDAVALAAAILRLLDDRALAARLGANARQRAEADFDLKKMAEAYRDLFERLRT
jgi:glycosyltransferase involved in cell wall biosynthesis